MPNGDPDFHVNEEPKLEAFFGPIAEVLTDFSRRHNLELQKYYHQASSWDLTFRHPQGGVGKIDVCRYTDETILLNDLRSLALGGKIDAYSHTDAKVFLASIWWYDDHDKLTRFIKHVKHEPISRDAQLLLEALESSLKLILSWQFGQWDDQYALT
jgi:hypothetical protein